MRYLLYEKSKAKENKGALVSASRAQVNGERTNTVLSWSQILGRFVSVRYIHNGGHLSVYISGNLEEIELEIH